MLTSILWALGLSFIFSFLLVPVAKRLAFLLGAVDKPNARKVHQKIMPRLGGVSIFCGFWLALFLTIENHRVLLPFFAGALVLFVVGVIDDMKELPAKVKLFGQIVAASIVAIFGTRIDYVTNVFNYEGNILPLAEWFAIPLTIIWIIGIINAINLIDGLDGLASGLSAIAALTMGILAFFNKDMLLAVILFALLGASLGFLPYNFNPASIFMGDTGSMFLGYALGVSSLMAAAKSLTFISVCIPILILGVPIFDTLFAIIRRMLSGKPIFEADKAHLHHQFLKRGFSHKRTVLTIYALSAGLSVSALILSALTTQKGFFFIVIILTTVILGAGKLDILGKNSQVKEEKNE